MVQKTCFNCTHVLKKVLLKTMYAKKCYAYTCLGHRCKNNKKYNKFCFIHKQEPQLPPPSQACTKLKPKPLALNFKNIVLLIFKLIF
jgi:hypothetical protein